MEKSKIVKKITKPVIFSLCCILLMGAVCIPTYAINEQDNLYFSVVNAFPYESTFVWDSELTYDLNGVPTIQTFGTSLLDVTSNYKPYDFATGYGFRLTFYTYVGAVIRIYDGKSDGATLLDSFNVTTDDVYLSVDFSDYAVPPVIRCMRSNNTTGDLATVRLYVILDEEEEIPPTEDWQDGYDKGYQQGYFDGNMDGFDDGYEQGLTDGYNNGIEEGRADGGFLSIITDPIGAMFGVTLLEIEGYPITIGAIFATLVGISLLMAFLKYFAGG